jgi:hypothetical protein
MHCSAWKKNLLKSNIAYCLNCLQNLLLKLRKLAGVNFAK